MKSKKPSYLLFFYSILFFLTFSIHAQKKEDISHNSLAEKIYLQLDKDTYRNDETIWFKATVVSASTHVPTDLSGVLHVELINSDKEVLETKLIDIEKGFCHGHFDLSKLYKDDVYILRAFTEWNKNFDEEFNFETQIRVYGFESNSKKKGIDHVILQKKEGKNNGFTLELFPQRIDSLHKRGVAVTVLVDGKKDTLLVKKDRATQKYLLDYKLPDTSKEVVVDFTTRNGKYYREVINFGNTIDLQFFPESGSLVHNLENKVGFKAMDSNGRGILVNGTILDQNGQLITTFQSNSQGMGAFVLNDVSSDDAYFAELKQGASEAMKRFPLPKVESIGNQIRVTRNTASVQIDIASNYKQNERIYLDVSSRGISYFLFEDNLENGKKSYEIAKSSLPDGIIAVKLMDASKNIMAERLFFNTNPTTRLGVKLFADKEQYLNREKTRLKIKVSDPIKTASKYNGSIKVVLKDELGRNYQDKQNILSYLLLSSDLKGTVENPGFYLGKASENDLDFLMLTQGWSKYNYIEKLKQIVVQPELNLNVEGYANVKGSKKKKSKYN